MRAYMRNMVIVVLLGLPLFGVAQAVKWEHARDYLSCKLALAAIAGKARTDSGIRGKLAQIEPALKGVTIAAPLNVVQLDGVLRDFSMVRVYVSDPMSRIDVKYFAGLAPAVGVRRLMDTAFAVVARRYVIDEGVKARLGAEVNDYLKQDTVVKRAVAGPVIAAGGQPNIQANQPAPVRRGFDFWVLLPILLLAGFAFIGWKRYEEIKEELRARKAELRSFNENYFTAVAGSARPGGADRKDVERLIANSNVLAELNEAIGKLQLRVSQLEGKGPVPSPAPVVKEKTRPKPSDGAARQENASADVFYMAGPVNNYFPNSAKSFTKDNTVYRFRLSANRQEAEYELHTSGAPIMEIVQLAESYIKAACDEENLPSYPVKNILTKKAGQAILEGDKWVIKSKALIRYE